MIHNWSYNHEYHEARGGGGGSFELAKMVVSVLHKWLQCKVKKLK